MKLWLCWGYLFAGVLSLNACGGIQTATESEPFAEASVEIRDAQASKVLSKSQDLVLVYARGLCCPSCALGVRKTLSRLDFVDTDAADRGVILDPKHQLVHVKLKPQNAADSKKIYQAIDDAGYDLVTIYRKDGQSIAKESAEAIKR
jgi:copper chaperone CopZ